ncbi:tyrosine-type recombinase/integrase [Sphaerobacter thermophilus]|uniref:Integrase family protein n=1 Tax=Sphaerobacter thermophilus (strain ATCC 49802 / DSM 20745 / KCCM 41009 / NCIMB 13125 / S 6022) TaxID=479434 RepID=D1C8V1_SPHTD|nr:tyrosine-type recombinase/integrase [Sphaerobacter thermophilus]ACZ40244.1 integrase family protein [Sphaerobacter thermophilus DSM 20745]
MARHRGNNEGSIRERPDGYWEARMTFWEQGTRRRKSFYGRTRQEVADKLARALVEQQYGLPVVSERETVKDYLERWLEDVARPSLRPRTYESYRGIITRHLTPALGRTRLARLSPDQVQRYINQKQAAGLSPRTVTYHRAVLRKALNDAMRWGLVSRNAAALAAPPKQDRPPARFLTPEEARHFLDTVAGHRLEALFTVALAVGLRQGEALGLRWDDVDLEAGTLTVRYALQRSGGALVLVEPKTQRSRRTVALPAVALRALREHRTRQLEERIAAPYWDDQGFVFTSTIGTAIDARNLTREFHRLRAEAGLPWLRFHDLRHGCASLLMAQGVNPRVVMEILGHSQITLTLGTYSHVAPTLARDAADKIDGILGVG